VPGREIVADTSKVLPEKGFDLPISWGDLGPKLISAGVIDKNKFEKVIPKNENEFIDIINAINNSAEDFDKRFKNDKIYGKLENRDVYIQAVLDYISGMTDVFALDLYRKINGNSLPAV
jgi:dGTP triphosphohydrolase